MKHLDVDIDITEERLKEQDFTKRGFFADSEIWGRKDERCLIKRIRDKLNIWFAYIND